MNSAPLTSKHKATHWTEAHGQRRKDKQLLEEVGREYRMLFGTERIIGRGFQFCQGMEG